MSFIYYSKLLSFRSEPLKVEDLRSEPTFGQKPVQQPVEQIVDQPDPEVAEKLQDEFQSLKQSLLSINSLVNQSSSSQITPELENNCNSAISLWNALIYEMSSK